MKKKTLDDMTIAGRVSFWLTNESIDGKQFDGTSLSKQFSADFGFAAHESTRMEVSTLNWSEEAKLVPIDTMLRRFSFEATWALAAIELAIANGWREARAAIVYYALAYDPALIVNRAALFTFIGTVDFDRG